MTRDAAADLPEEVLLEEVLAWEKEDMRGRGESVDIVYVDGVAFRPDGPPATRQEFTEALRDSYRANLLLKQSLLK